MRKKFNELALVIQSVRIGDIRIFFSFMNRKYF